MAQTTITLDEAVKGPLQALKPGVLDWSIFMQCLLDSVDPDRLVANLDKGVEKVQQDALARAKERYGRRHEKGEFLSFEEGKKLLERKKAERAGRLETSNVSTEMLKAKMAATLRRLAEEDIDPTRRQWGALYEEREAPSQIHAGKIKIEIDLGGALRDAVREQLAAELSEHRRTERKAA